MTKGPKPADGHPAPQGAIQDSSLGMICEIKLSNKKAVAQGIAERWVYSVVMVVEWVYADECARVVCMCL